MGAAVGQVGLLLPRLRHAPPRPVEGAYEIHIATPREEEGGGQFPAPLPAAVQITAGRAVCVCSSAESVFEPLHGYTVVIVARQSVPGEKAVSSIIPVNTSWPATQW